MMSRSADAEGGVEARRATGDGHAGSSADIVARLRRPGPMVGVELRPPRLGLDAPRGMDVWIDMYHAVRRLARNGIFVLLTDDAAGDPEEESVAHLATNLGSGADLETVVPFLTCKHPLEYCRLFARRAAGLGVAGVAVVGGDHSVGPGRCVPHGKDLRAILRREQPGFPLGGWANPHRDPVEQARFVADDDFSADFVLTQIVSHHSIGRVEMFRAELERLGVDIPVVYGVFLYRSANSRDARVPQPLLSGSGPRDHGGIRGRDDGRRDLCAVDPPSQGGRSREGLCEQPAGRRGGGAVGEGGGGVAIHPPAKLRPASACWNTILLCRRHHRLVH